MGGRKRRAFDGEDVNGSVGQSSFLLCIFELYYITIQSL